MLGVRDLGVSFATNDGRVNAVNGVSFAQERGQTLGIVGESGSGKSQLAFAIMGLLAKNGTARGSATFDGVELIGAPLAVLNRVRANKIAMVFHDPMTRLNPYLRVADQMAEGLIHHKGMSKAQAMAECVRMLDAVKIPDARGRIGLYPHEFSGGMRQRVMIAISLLCKPDLLIADAPTTAPEVTVQAQILRLLGDLQHDFGMATILISHDLGVIAGFCREGVVMSGGQVMEQAPVEPFFAAPSHPYPRGLLPALPRVDQEGGELSFDPRIAAHPDAGGEGLSGRATLRFCVGGLRGAAVAADRVCAGASAGLQPVGEGTDMTALIEARDLRVTVRISREDDMPWTRPRALRAVNGVDFTLNGGETLGIVGESGSGKSTLARALIQMVPTKGRVIWQGKTDLLALSAREMLADRSGSQMVFQDPLASRNRRMTVGQIVSEPPRSHHPGLSAAEVKARVQLVMDRVGLLPNQINRYPHEFSGGQCQRIGVARALIVEPRAPDLRRAGVGAGCVHSGAGDQPVVAAAKGTRAGDDRHCP